MSKKVDAVKSKYINTNPSENKGTTTNATTSASKYVKPAEVKENKGLNASSFFLFEKTNFTILIAGLIVIAIGYVLMSGGGSDDPNVFNEAEIFSFRRVTLAPIVVLIGFIIEFFAIFYVPKNLKTTNEEDTKTA